MKTLSLFRTRAPHRDARTDTMRRAAIADAIERQRADALREREGLAARMRDHYGRAATALETTAGFATRPPQDESAIIAFEHSAAAASQRIAHLDAELALYDALCTQLAPDPAPATP